MAAIRPKSANRTSDRVGILGVGGNTLRAAVLGANDGLVSNLSLVMGVAGSGAGRGPILIAGLAGLVAGSLSMALGEWLSVQSAREMYANQLDRERREIRDTPEEEEEELREIYESKGIPGRYARDIARRVVYGKPEIALDVMAREELGINPDELGGSAWAAAITSFLFFGLGAAVPLLPFLLSQGIGAMVAAWIISAFALFGAGWLVTAFTGRHPVRSGFRSLLFGLAAAAITYGIGSLVGVAVR